jgi:hypothetical protein
MLTQVLVFSLGEMIIGLGLKISTVSLICLYVDGSSDSGK